MIKGLIVMFSVSCLVHAEGIYNITRLMPCNNRARPVSNPNDTIAMNMTMYLVSIADMDFKKQTVAMKLFIEFSWIDHCLLSLTDWKIGDDRVMSLDSQLIWLPDLLVGSGFAGIRFNQDQFGNVLVNKKGKVTAWISVQTETSIDAEITYYPFDVQEVRIMFSPWTLPSEDLMLSSEGDSMSLEYYGANGEWTILTSEIVEVNSSYDNLIYTNVLYIFTLQRQSLFPVLSMVLPVVLTSCLNIFVFILPVQGGERLPLCVTVFLTLSVFLSIVDQTLPKSSNGVSIFVVYLGLQLYGSVMTIISTCFMINIHHQYVNSKQNRFYRVLSTLCCIKDTVGNGPKKIHYLTNPETKNTASEKIVHGEDKETRSCSLNDRLDVILFRLSIVWNVMLISVFLLAANLA